MVKFPIYLNRRVFVMTLKMSTEHSAPSRQHCDKTERLLEVTYHPNKTNTNKPTYLISEVKSFEPVMKSIPLSSDQKGHARKPEGRKGKVL